MAYFSGVNGQLFIDGQRAAQVVNWTIQSNLGMLDATTLEDTDRVSVPGIRSMTGSCQLFYYQPTSGSNTGNSAATLIDKLIKARTQGSDPGKAAEADLVDLKLVIQDGSTNGRVLDVAAYLTSVMLACTVG